MQRFLLALTLAAMPLLGHAIEEPEYEVIRTFDNVELRHYSPYVVAEVVLDASAEAAGNQAFPILAGYIFGKNKGEKKFAMTAPVTQTAATMAPIRMDMTAPVTQAVVAGGMQVQFVLPKGVTLVDVGRGGPAERAGLQPFRRGQRGEIVQGDVITAINDQPVADLDEMLAQLERFQPGETVTLTLWRAGQTRKQAVVLAKPD